MESLAVVTVNNTNRHPTINNCNTLGGSGGQGVGLVNGPANCLEVMAGVEGLDLLVTAQHQQQTEGLTSVAILKTVPNPRQLNTLPIVESPTIATAVLLNPVNIITGLPNSLHGSGVAANNNNTNNNLNNLIQLTGDHTLTQTTTATTSITTVKVEPSALVQQPVPVQLHSAANVQQPQSAMTNKRNRMEV